MMGLEQDLSIPLYGVFSDPNFAGATSVAVIFLAVKLLMTNKNKLQKFIA